MNDMEKIAKDKNKYWNEKETMEFLQIKATSLKNLVKKQLLGRYQIGVRYFFDPNEIMAFIEASKQKEQNIKALKEYQKIPKLRGGEHLFIVSRAKDVLSIIEQLDVNWLSDREKNILLKTISRSGDFEGVAQDYNISRERSRQIFETALRRLRNGCLRMKKEYDENYIHVHEKNNELYQENKEFKRYISELPDNKKNLFEEIINKTNILSLRLIDMDLSIRAMNCLKYANIDTIGDLVSYTKQELLKFRNFGKRSLNELEELIEKYDLRFGSNFLK